MGLQDLFIYYSTLDFHFLDFFFFFTEFIYASIFTWDSINLFIKINIFRHDFFLHTF